MKQTKRNLLTVAILLLQVTINYQQPTFAQSNPLSIKENCNCKDKEISFGSITDKTQFKRNDALANSTDTINCYTYVQSYDRLELTNITVNTYNEKGYIIQVEKFMTLYGNSDKTDKDVYSYNSNNERTEWLHYAWNTYTKKWEYEIKVSYTFNIKGEETQRLLYMWSNNTWVESVKSTLTYSTGAIELTAYIFKNGKWENSTKENYTLNGNSDITVFITSKWDGSQWVNQSKETTSYNSSNLSAELYFYEWQTNGWSSLGKMTYTYDNGKLKEALQYQWNGSGWNNQYKFTNTYNTDGSLAEDKTYDWYYLIPDAGAWREYAKCLYGKKTATTITEQSSVFTEQFNVYPNPSSGAFELMIQNIGKGIQNSKLIIYDVLGQVVYQQRIENPQTQIDLSSEQIKRGIYVIELQNEGQSYYQKMLIQ